GPVRRRHLIGADPPVHLPAVKKCDNASQCVAAWHALVSKSSAETVPSWSGGKSPGTSVIRWIGLSRPERGGCGRSGRNSKRSETASPLRTSPPASIRFSGVIRLSVPTPSCRSHRSQLQSRFASSSTSFRVPSDSDRTSVISPPRTLCRAVFTCNGRGVAAPAQVRFTKVYRDHGRGGTGGGPGPGGRG